VPREEETAMSRTKHSPAETDTQAHVRQRALEAVQEAMDRRDNGGDAAATTEN
jgi:hypothetical protein